MKKEQTLFDIRPLFEAASAVTEQPYKETEEDALHKRNKIIQELKEKKEMGTGTSTIFDLPIEEATQNFKTRNPNGISINYRNELADRIKAMGEEELQIVVENIPVDLCFQRIRAELDRAKEFENTVSNAMKLIKKDNA